MTNQKILSVLIEMGQKEVSEYDRVRAQYKPGMTDVPFDCLRSAARIGQLSEVAAALGLMGYEEYSTTIHEPEHGPKGVKIVAVDLRMRRMGEIHPEPEPNEDEEGYK